MLRKLALILSITGGLGATYANALGLGDIKVNSALNEPLNAQIQLRDVRKLTPLQIQPRLANNDFGAAGVSNAALGEVDFNVSVLPDGTGYIYLTSDTPVREPFVNFLLEVNWPTGRMVHEYTLLLDPPTYDPSRLRSLAQPALPAPTRSVTPTPAAATLPEPMADTRVSVQPAPSTRSQAPGEPVRNIRTEMDPDAQVYVDVHGSLWGVANEYKERFGASTSQMAIALLKRNPDAFFGNNINRVKAGSVLNLPSQALVDELTPAQASAEVQRQNRAWQAYRSGGQPAVAQAPTRPAAPVVEPVAPAPAEVVAEEAPLEAPINNEALGALEEQNLQLEQQLDSTLSDVEHLRGENLVLNSQIDIIQDELGDIQQAIEAKDRSIRELEAQLAAQAAEAETEANKSLLDKLMGSPMLLGGIGGGLILALLGLLLFLRRRKKDDEEESIDDLVDEPKAPVAAPEPESEPEPEAEAAVTEAEVEDAPTADAEPEKASDDDVDDLLEQEDDLDDLSDLDLDMGLDLDDDLTTELEMTADNAEDFDLGADDDKATAASSLDDDDAGELEFEFASSEKEAAAAAMTVDFDDADANAEEDALAAAAQEDDDLDIDLDLDGADEAPADKNQDSELDLDFGDLEDSSLDGDDLGGLDDLDLEGEDDADIDDIDALLASVSSDAAAEVDAEEEVAGDDVDALLASISSDAPTGDDTDDELLSLDELLESDTQAEGDEALDLDLDLDETPASATEAEDASVDIDAILDLEDDGGPEPEAKTQDKDDLALDTSADLALDTPEAGDSADELLASLDIDLDDLASDDITNPDEAVADIEEAPELSQEIDLDGLGDIGDLETELDLEPSESLEEPIELDTDLEAEVSLDLEETGEEAEAAALVEGLAEDPTEEEPSEAEPELEVSDDLALDLAPEEEPAESLEESLEEAFEVTSADLDDEGVQASAEVEEAEDFDALMGNLIEPDDDLGDVNLDEIADGELSLDETLLDASTDALLAETSQDLLAEEIDLSEEIDIAETELSVDDIELPDEPLVTSEMLDQEFDEAVALDEDAEGLLEEVDSLDSLEDIDASLDEALEVASQSAAADEALKEDLDDLLDTLSTDIETPELSTADDALAVVSEDLLDLDLSGEGEVDLLEDDDLTLDEALDETLDEEVELEEAALSEEIEVEDAADELVESDVSDDFMSLDIDAETEESPADLEALMESLPGGAQNVDFEGDLELDELMASHSIDLDEPDDAEGEAEAEQALETEIEDDIDWQALDHVDLDIEEDADDVLVELDDVLAEPAESEAPAKPLTDSVAELSADEPLAERLEDEVVELELAEDIFDEISHDEPVDLSLEAELDLEDLLDTDTVDASVDVELSPDDALDEELADVAELAELDLAEEMAQASQPSTTADEDLDLDIDEDLDLDLDLDLNLDVDEAEVSVDLEPEAASQDSAPVEVEAADEDLELDIDVDDALNEASASNDLQSSGAEPELELDLDLDLDAEDEAETPAEALYDEEDIEGLADFDLAESLAQLSGDEEVDEAELDKSLAEVEGLDAMLKGLLSDEDMNDDLSDELNAGLGEVSTSVDLNAEVSLEDVEAELTANIEHDLKGADDLDDVLDSIDDVDRDIDLDLEGFDEADWAMASDVDESETKLDLARAYLDMDDPAGAEEILKEVLAEGDDRQSEEAKQLLATIKK